MKVGCIVLYYMLELVPMLCPPVSHAMQADRKNSAFSQQGSFLGPEDQHNRFEVDSLFSKISGIREASCILPLILLS